MRGDAFDQIGCLTAVMLDWRALWQQGRPNPKNALLTNDTPFQIHDLDGDGRVEVALARDFELQVLDGRTGRLLRNVWLPQLATDCVVADTSYKCWRFAPVSRRSRWQWRAAGNPAERPLSRFWIFEQHGAVWQGDGGTGHYLFPFDVDRDGRQEFLIGYSLWGADGKRRWSHDAELKDHADALSLGNFTGRQTGDVRAYIDGSDEGFLVIAADGTIVKHLRLGHAQTQSIGKVPA